MTTINCFYKGTSTIDYSIQVTKVNEGVEVTCFQHNLEDEFFPVDSAQQFIEEYGDEYVSASYEIVKSKTS